MIELSKIKTAWALKTEYVAVLNKNSSKPLTPGNSESKTRTIHRQISKGSTMAHNKEMKIFDNKNNIRAPAASTMSKVAVTMTGTPSHVSCGVSSQRHITAHESGSHRATGCDLPEPMPKRDERRIWSRGAGCGSPDSE
jgi:hypothetical protein